MRVLVRVEARAVRLRRLLVHRAVVRLVPLPARHHVRVNQRLLPRRAQSALATLRRALRQTEAAELVESSAQDGVVFVDFQRAARRERQVDVFGRLLERVQRLGDSHDVVPRRLRRAFAAGAGAAGESQGHARARDARAGGDGRQPLERAHVRENERNIGDRRRRSARGSPSPRSSRPRPSPASGVLRLNVPHGSILAIPGAGGSGAPSASEGGISSPSAEDDAPPLSTSRPGASAATDCAGPIDNLARFTVSIASAAVIPFCAATYPNARANVSNVSRRSPHGVASANATSSAPTSKSTSNTSALRANRVHR